MGHSSTGPPNRTLNMHNPIPSRSGCRIRTGSWIQETWGHEGPRRNRAVSRTTYWGNRTSPSTLTSRSRTSSRASWMRNPRPNPRCPFICTIRSLHICDNYSSSVRIANMILYTSAAALQDIQRAQMVHCAFRMFTTATISNLPHPAWQDRGYPLPRKLTPRRKPHHPQCSLCTPDEYPHACVKSSSHPGFTDTAGRKCNSSLQENCISLAPLQLPCALTWPMCRRVLSPL